MFKYALVQLDRDANHSVGYRLSGFLNFNTEWEARDYFRDYCFDCDRVDLIEYGVGLIETFHIFSVVE